MSAPRDWITEDEHIALVAAGNVFWHKLADLLAEALVLFDPAIHGTVQAYLQDKCSLYSVDVESAMQGHRPFLPGMKMSQECKHAQHRNCTAANCWCACHRRCR